MTNDLPTLLAGARAVLFDFDGPLCDVFAGLPASTVARRLEKLIGEQFDTDDPLQVLRESVSFGADVVREVEQALIVAEMEAVACSVTTAGGVESLRACLEKGKAVGVVSNNSAQAVDVFLKHADLGLKVRPVVGRRYGDPARMKPHPWPLEMALAELGLCNDEVLFVGDSLTDLEAAQAVGMPCLAYVNKPYKRSPFLPRASALVGSMWQLESALKES